MSIALLVFTVMPNFAQDVARDNNQGDEQTGSAPISSEKLHTEMRAVLTDMLLGDQMQGETGQIELGTIADDSWGRAGQKRSIEH